MVRREEKPTIMPQKTEESKFIIKISKNWDEARIFRPKPHSELLDAKPRRLEIPKEPKALISFNVRKRAGTDDREHKALGRLQPLTKELPKLS